MSQKTSQALIALGANLPSQYGQPPATLTAAQKAMHSAGLTILKESPLYKTAPVPVSDQPWYYNSVVIIKTALAPRELLSVLNQIEEKFGRIRTVANAPRILDLDIVAYDGEVIGTDDLVIPHPRMHERAFVLYPLRDIVPAWRHPVSGATVEEMIEKLSGDQKIEQCDE